LLLTAGERERMTLNSTHICEYFIVN